MTDDDEIVSDTEQKALCGMTAAEHEAFKERFGKVYEDASKSLPGSREALQKFSSGYPTVVGALLVRDFGNAANQAENALVAYTSRGSVLRDETTRIWLKETRAGLAEPGDTALEDMLAHRVSLCWLAVNDAENVRAHRWNSTDGITHEAADFWDRRLSRLNADLFKATRALATVRKLRRSVVQVNVAEQQVNVGNLTR